MLVTLTLGVVLMQERVLPDRLVWKEFSPISGFFIGDPSDAGQDVLSFIEGPSIRSAGLRDPGERLDVSRSFVEYTDPAGVMIHATRAPGVHRFVRHGPPILVVEHTPSRLVACCRYGDRVAILNQHGTLRLLDTRGRLVETLELGRITTDILEDWSGHYIGGFDGNNSWYATIDRPDDRRIVEGRIDFGLGSRFTRLVEGKTYAFDPENPDATDPEPPRPSRTTPFFEIDMRDPDIIRWTFGDEWHEASLDIDPTVEIEVIKSRHVDFIRQGESYWRFEGADARHFADTPLSISFYSSNWVCFRDATRHTPDPQRRSEIYNSDGLLVRRGFDLPFGGSFAIFEDAMFFGPRMPADAEALAAFPFERLDERTGESTIIDLSDWIGP